MRRVPTRGTTIRLRSPAPREAGRDLRDERPRENQGPLPCPRRANLGALARHWRRGRRCAAHYTHTKGSVADRAELCSCRKMPLLQRNSKATRRSRTGDLLITKWAGGRQHLITIRTLCEANMAMRHRIQCMRRHASRGVRDASVTQFTRRFASSLQAVLSDRTARASGS
jgi:hypothetical protein